MGRRGSPPLLVLAPGFSLTQLQLRTADAASGAFHFGVRSFSLLLLPATTNVVCLIGVCLVLTFFVSLDLAGPDSS
jgi:hypothetical protein